MNWYQCLGNIFILYYSLVMPIFVSCLLQPANTHFGRDVFFIENQHSPLNKLIAWLQCSGAGCGITSFIFCRLISAPLNVLLKSDDHPLLCNHKQFSLVLRQLFILFHSFQVFWEKHYSRVKSPNSGFEKLHGGLCTLLISCDFGQSS